MFGDVDYRPNLAYSGAVPLEEQLEALGDAVRAGKVRHIGLSNETAWGLMKCMHAGAEGSCSHLHTQGFTPAYFGGNHMSRCRSVT